jgi:hypothetical protein
MADYISVTDTAKIIRGELKKHFPGVIFRVRSSSYSMGASIDISWTDGPTSKEVRVITNQFNGSIFDGMTDMKSSRYAQWEGREVRWGSDYVFPTRKYSKQFYRQVAERICKKYSVPVPEIKQSSYEYRGKTEFGNPYIEDSHVRISGYDTLSDLINKALAKTPANAPQNLGSDSDINGITVTVTENHEQNGIEIKFSDKPPADIIQAIKDSAGFKYSRAKNIWYAKRTDAKLAFAKSLVEFFNQPQDEYKPDLADDNTDIFLAAMQAMAEVNELLATLGL